ncbi:unnamed protein product [Victoria cruziana]
MLSFRVVGCCIGSDLLNVKFKVNIILTEEDLVAVKHSCNIRTIVAFSLHDLSVENFYAESREYSRFCTIHILLKPAVIPLSQVLALVEQQQRL